MISDKKGNDLMIVGSVTLAAKVIKSSKGSAGLMLTGKRKSVKGYILKEVV